jgi:hypothetical protein
VLIDVLNKADHSVVFFGTHLACESIHQRRGVVHHSVKCKIIKPHDDFSTIQTRNMCVQRLVAEKVGSISE